MNNKKILIISPFFFPELISTGKFNTDMAIALRNRGHKVTVICSHPLYPKWVPEKSSQEIEGINIIRGGARVRYSKKPFVRRVVLEVWYALYVLRNILRHRNIDLIIPVFPPSLAFYLLVPFLGRRIEKIGMVHDLQEVYSKGKKGTFNALVSFFINRIERTTFQGCDKLIFLSEEMKNTAKEFYKLEESKLVVQYPFATVKTQEILTKALEDILPIDKAHIVYSGALGEKQNPKGVYDFFDFASKNIENSDFHFFSEGRVFEKLKQTNRNDNIKFHNLVDKEDIEELYARSTVQIIPQLSGTSRGSLPSKLANLLASECKILFITDPGSEIEELFRKYDLEKVVVTWDNKILLKSLLELLEKKSLYKGRQKDVAQKLFSLESMIQKIA